MAEKKKEEGVKKDEGSLLPLVEEKERLLEQMLDETRKKGELSVQTARAEAEAHIEKVKAELPEISRRRLEAGLKGIEAEVQKIKEQGMIELQSVNKRAEKQIEGARRLALKVCLPELEQC
jgi:vacuolar-type H+-ATPase subunit H